MVKIIKELGMKYPEKARSATPRLRAFVLVECACGTQWEAQKDNINAGRTTKCKECQREETRKRQTKHGGYSKRKPSRIMAIYKNMLNRCYKSTCKAYKDYGSKGVTVCDEWKDPETGFSDFRTWSLANGYQDDLVCDKDYLCDKLQISPKVYSPSTCQWVTRAQNGAYTSRLSEEAQKILVDKYLVGTTPQDIAVEYDYTYQGILYILEKHKVYTPKPNKQKQTPETV